VSRTPRVPASRRGCGFHCRLRVTRKPRARPRGYPAGRRHLDPSSARRMGARSQSAVPSRAVDPREKRATMLADLDLLLTAVFATAHDRLPREGERQAQRDRRGGRHARCHPSQEDIAPDRELLALARGRLGHLFPKRGAADSPALGPLPLGRLRSSPPPRCGRPHRTSTRCQLPIVADASFRLGKRASGFETPASPWQSGRQRCRRRGSAGRRLQRRVTAVVNCCCPREERPRSVPA
jgi:hypothetical protein